MEPALTFAVFLFSYFSATAEESEENSATVKEGVTSEETTAAEESEENSATTDGNVCI